ncbi:MAG TPA: AAA family ATPase [Bryobacteraceae bacterium]
MAQPGGVVRFTHLILENWRNFTRVEAALRNRVIVTGPVAGGKTNLLDALLFLHDVAAEGGFQAAIAKRGGLARLRCLAAPASAEVSIAVRAAAGEAGGEWSYSLRFAQDAQRRPVIACERVACGDREILARPDERDRRDPRLLSATALEQLHANREFRDLAGWFGSIRAAADGCVPRLLAAVAATPENTAAVRLRRILDLIRPLVPQLEALDFRRDARGAPHLRARFGYAQGAWQTEEQLSAGTLRMLALAWDAMEGAGPLLIEEPERSLDAAAIRNVLPMLRAAARRGERQLLVASHSRELLADESVTPDEVLLLEPGEDGTTARAPSCFVPADEEQLALFEES